ncbi:MAG TPA: hypothetical protein VFV34_22205 [Blastocatellia bacterium]|nr:hypothetical protein [Blastocatellia bacterium]
MNKLRNYRTKLTQWKRRLLTLSVTDESAATNRGRTQKNRAMRKRSLALAIIVAAFVLLPLSRYGLAEAQDAGSVQETTDESTIQFNLVPAADAIANCFPNATAKVTVLRTEEEVGTDTFTLTVKRFRPNTTFAVFLTELPVAPFGAVQYLADFTTNAGGKGTVQVHAIIEEAFISQAIDGQRVRKDLNNVVFWFADPADANECFAPGVAPITPFDGDGVAGPAAMSSKNSLPGAPLP